MTTSSRRVALVGLDSITPMMIDRFMAEGRMPHLQRLREQGRWSELTSTMPPTTPTAWTTIATGSWPSTHGIEGFAVHLPGEPLDKKHHSCSSEWVKSETLWQAAERAGKRTILLKYPVSWPPTGGERVLQVDGAGGWGGLKCVWDLLHSGCWDTHAHAASHATQAAGQEWITRDQDNLDEEVSNLLETSLPGEAWAHLPPQSEPAWETKMTLRSRGMREGCTLYLLAFHLHGAACLAIAANRDAPAPIVLKNREWSDWLRLTLPTEAGLRSGYLRLKVMEFDIVTQRLKLYQSQVHQETGFTQPASIAQELLEAAGPFAEWTEGYDRLQGWIDDETQLEIYEQHVEWMSRAAGYLLREHPWDLFMTQVHFVDMAYHLYWGAIDPGHPQYDPEKAPAYWELLGRVHELADQFVGAVVAALPPDTVVIVLGDHGHDLYHTTLQINHLLVEHGFLALYRDRRSGAARIDWSRTRAYGNSYRIFVNLEGRDPGGIVRPDEYEATQEALIQMLYSVRDPQRDRAVARLVIRGSDAQTLGLYGGGMGDVILATSPGYQIRSAINVPTDGWVGPRLLPEKLAVLTPTQLFRDFTGEHDTSLPFTRSIRSLLLLAGPGVRPGQRQVPARMVDVAPTICHYLDIPLPAQCEGSVLADVLLAESEAEPVSATAAAHARPESPATAAALNRSVGE